MSTFCRLDMLYNITILTICPGELIISSYIIITGTVVAVSGKQTGLQLPCRDVQNIEGKTLFCFTDYVSPPLSQRQTSNGMAKPILYHKTHTAWQKSYCMSFAMPSYFPWIHGKTHVISAPSYPWLFPCSNLSLVSQLFAFDSTF